jgi:DNA-binding CsgD family transcriptional regulator
VGAAGASDPLGLIGEIYDAALDASLWPGVLERLTDILRGQVGVLMRPPAPLRSGAMVSVRADPEMQRLYVERYRDANPIARACAALPVATVRTDRMLVPLAQFHRSEFYNDFSRRMDSETWIGVPLVKGGGSQFTASRTPRQGEWEAADLNLLKELVPHLRRAVEMNRRLADAELGRVTNAVELINGLPHAAFLLGDDGDLIFANAVGETLLADGSGIRFVGGILQAATPALTTTLVASVARAARGRPADAGDAITLPRPSGRPLVVLIAHVSLGIEWPFHPRPSVMMLALESGLGNGTPMTQAAEAIALAPRERECLRRVAMGASSKMIARELALSPHTVDQYIASAMRKLDAASRAEAVSRAFAVGLVA